MKMNSYKRYIQGNQYLLKTPFITFNETVANTNLGMYLDTVHILTNGTAEIVIQKLENRSHQRRNPLLAGILSFGLPDGMVI